jgi:hypothetical protein|tara:strand:- start:80 stop:220 length:141 start_codon:yes stop_codon:yes gene_type:complete
MMKDWTGNKSAGSATPKKASKGSNGNSNAKAKKTGKPSYKAPNKQH